MRTKELAVSNISIPLQIGLVLSATILLPLFIHLIPSINGVPVGAYLIPFFYAPLIAIYLFKPLPVAFAGVLAPFIYYLISGAPAINMVSVISLEIVSFIYLMHIMNTTFNKAIWIAPAAYLSAKIVSFLILFLLPVDIIISTPVNHLLTSTFYALPGMAVLFIISLYMRKNY